MAISKLTPDVLQVNPLGFFLKRNAPGTVHFLSLHLHVTFFHSILSASLIGLNWLSLEPLIVY